MGLVGPEICLFDQLVPFSVLLTCLPRPKLFDSVCSSSVSRNFCHFGAKFDRSRCCPLELNTVRLLSANQIRSHCFVLRYRASFWWLTREFRCCNKCFAQFSIDLLCWEKTADETEQVLAPNSFLYMELKAIWLSTKILIKIRT